MDEIGSRHLGYCPICERKVEFYIGGKWLRDSYICTICWSNPRQRALTLVLNTILPNYREFNIHETSPDGANSKKFANECAKYSSSQYLPDVPFGYSKDGIRCESVEFLTFQDEEFDVFISQDVFEHVMDPIRGFQEVMRTIKPNGFHLFTVPCMKKHKTSVRVQRVNGDIEYLKEKEYHQNPVDPNGSLVVTSWGNDMKDIIKEKCGYDLQIYDIVDRHFGLDGEFLEVFVMRKGA